MKRQTVIKFGSVLVILSFGFLGMFLLSSSDKHSNARDFKPEVRTVNTEKVFFGSHTIEIEGNGVIEPQQTLNIISEATGVVLFAKNNLKNGTFVQTGEVILEIDSREIENNLYSLRSAFLNSLASLLPDLKIENEEIYNKWYNYFYKIDIHKELPELPKITEQQEKIQLSTRDIFNKYYTVKTQEIILSKYKITAPFDGFIKSNGILENSYVSKGEHLFTMSDAKNLEIAVPLLVEEINMIDFTSSPSVIIYSDKNKNDVITGKILRRETNLDPNSQTLNVYVSLKNNNLNPYFLPGNYVTLKIKGLHLSDVAAVPRNLINNDGFIYVMKEGKLAQEKVDLVTIQGNKAIIRNSMKEGTSIVTTILQKPLIGMGIQSAEEVLSPQEDELNESTIDQLSKVD